AAQEPQRAGIAVIALGHRERDYAVPLVAALRALDEAPPITMDYHDAKIAAHLKRADRANARAAIIIGEQELETHTLTLRDLVQRTQESLDEGETLGHTARRILERYALLCGGVTA
ncbi:MAG TPA: His/Gly/Thr/Pro-type tRNA ligase C-terminal domain-containing protein, partial [Candidatus Acidoferrales bacterium]|nr:His/Gly/Thr/Pro-type tRNA ligase C-terminal domain-containing protein [Candidatus Acidoferrales bacterium]